MHVDLALTPRAKTKGSSCVTESARTQLAHVLSVSVPMCRVSPANERGDGRGGRVYLLTGHLRPGEQRLRQLLHQTGALRSRRQDGAGRTGSGPSSGKPQGGLGTLGVKLALSHTQTNATGLRWSQYKRCR